MIKFKRNYPLKDEWKLLLMHNPHLMYIVMTMHFLLGNIEITHIFRTRGQQRKFYPDQPKKRSVHEFWRGVDISVRDQDMYKVEKVIEDINKQFEYSDKHSTAVLHDVGYGLHIHVQTPQTASLYI